MEDEFAVARKFYQAYGSFTDWKNFQGNPMPVWEELPLRIQLAWDAVTKVAVNPEWRDVLNEREKKILKNSEEYSKDAFGDSGHNMKLLIAHLSQILDDGE